MEWLEITVQIASLGAIILAVWGLALNSRAHRRQSNAQVFLEYTGRYEQIMASFPSDALRARLNLDGKIPEESEALTLALLRYLNICSEEYYLWRKHYLKDDVWQIWEGELKRTLRSPLMRRAWESLEPEFQSYPEFVFFVKSVQETKAPTSS